MDDNIFRTLLRDLNTAKQRTVAAAFVESVLPLCSDPRISTVIALVKRGNVTSQELEAAHQMVNAVRLESFCPSEKETDWQIQFGHFVSRAVLDCVKPAREDINLAWDAAMNVRIARTCECIALGDRILRQEAEIQYRILSDFIHPQG